MCGYNVIPTASWGDLDSFSYCFEGLPIHSVVAVSSRGNRLNTDAYNRWCYGLHRLEEGKQPIIVVGYSIIILLSSVDSLCITFSIFFILGSYLKKGSIINTILFDFDADFGVFACGYGANFSLWSVFWEFFLCF